MLIDNGSSVRVQCVLPDSVSVQADWKTVAVTGISSFEVVSIHLVSAWTSENGLALGHVRIADTSNEILAKTVYTLQEELPGPDGKVYVNKKMI